MSDESIAPELPPRQLTDWESPEMTIWRHGPFELYQPLGAHRTAAVMIHGSELALHLGTHPTADSAIAACRGMADTLQRCRRHQFDAAAAAVREAADIIAARDA